MGFSSPVPSGSQVKMYTLARRRCRCRSPCNLACSIGDSRSKNFNDDPGMTMTYFTPRSNLDAYDFQSMPMRLNGKMLRSHLKG